MCGEVCGWGLWVGWVEVYWVVVWVWGGGWSGDGWPFGEEDRPEM